MNKNALSLLNPSPNIPKTRNRKRRMSDAEMITILVLFHSNTFRNFKHFYLFYVCRELKEEFPNLLSYTRFVERMPRVAVPLLLFLKLALMGECTGITFIDSTRIPVCENKRVYSNCVFKGYAHNGKSTMSWYYGFKLPLLCNERGELLNFALTKANVNDRNPEVFNNLTKDLFGKSYADKGYISQSLFASLFDRGVHIVTGIRTNMKNRLMDVYDKKCSVKEALSRPSTICSRTWRRLFLLDTEVSQTLLSAFWQEWRLIHSTIQSPLSIWSSRWREKQR